MRIVDVLSLINAMKIGTIGKFETMKGFHLLMI